MKNKIHNYDFLIVGAGLIGSLAAIKLFKKKYSVLVIDKNAQLPKDNRTLAVNANSKDFLEFIGLWDRLKSQPEPIEKIIIKDQVNHQPLVFENAMEEMGNVVFNREVLIEARKELKKNKLLIEGVNVEISNIIPNQKIFIKNNNFIFKNVILTLGKKFDDNPFLKKFSFPSGHSSYVGFFNHTLKHNQTAYEIFTKDGPLAILPSPNKLKKKSTFIFSTKKKISKIRIKNLINKYFKQTHGAIKLEGSLGQFEILPHLTKEISDKYILIGDTLRSIHPVAGQGWNLGIKDIQCLDNLLDLYDLNDQRLIKNYYIRRNLENVSYLSFTSSINLVYENPNLITNFIAKVGFSTLRSFSFLRRVFINQAMGRSKLI